MKTNHVRIVFSTVFILTGIAGTRVVASQPDSERREAVRRAIAWLVKTEEHKDWGKVVQDGYANNALSERDLATLMTAWLLEVNSDFAEFSPEVRRRFHERAERLLAGGGSLPSEIEHQNIYANWLGGFAGLYAYERSLRDARPHPAVDLIARGFIKRQNLQGGWGHGQSDPLVSFYPATLIATTNLALLTLGAAERTKASIVKEPTYQRAVSNGLKLLRDVQGPHGGLPYGDRLYRTGCEAGRTASALLALVALRETDSDLFQQAATYVLHNLEAIPEGHAGPPLHVALGAMSCYVLSGDAWQQYDMKVLKRVRKAQRKDGSFGYRLEESKEVDSNERHFDTAYATALYALALSADRTEVARRLRLSTPFQAAPLVVNREPVKSPAPTWQLDLSDVENLVADSKVVVALQKDGTLTFIAAASGELLGKVHLSVKADEVELKIRDRKALVLVPASQSSKLNRLWCIDPKREKPVWQVEVSGQVKRWRVDDEQITVLSSEGKGLISPGGEVTSIARSSGQIVHRFSVGTVQPSFHVLALAGDRYAFATSPRLSVYDNKGHVVWKCQNQTGQRLTPAAYTALAAETDRLYTGSSDGHLACRSQETGKVEWNLQLGSVVKQIYVRGTNPERLLVIAEDGLVYGLRDGQVAWQLNVSRGIERDRGLVYQSTAAGLVAAQPWHGRFVLIDPERGRLLWERALPGKLWTATDHHLVTWSDGQVKTYPLQEIKE